MTTFNQDLYSPTKDAGLEFIAGGRGSGKTTKIKNMIADIDRLIVIDPQQDFPEKTGNQPMKRPAHKEISEILKKAVKGAKFRVALTPYKNPVAFVDYVIKSLKVVQSDYYNADQDKVKSLPKVWLVIDEADIFYGHGKSYSLELEGLIRRGRHYGIELIMATQFPTQVRPDARRNATRTSFFRVGNDADAIRYVATCLGGGDYLELIRKLPPHEAYCTDINKDNGAVFLYKNPPLKKK